MPQGTETKKNHPECRMSNKRVELYQTSKKLVRLTMQVRLQILKFYRVIILEDAPLLLMWISQVKGEEGVLKSKT